MDIMIAVVVFIGAVFIFYSVLSAKHGSSQEELQGEASVVLGNAMSENSDIGIINGSEVDAKRLEELLGEDYDAIKKMLRLKNEFCIFLEDENGNVVYIESEGSDYAGIGSGKITISDTPCGEPYTAEEP